MAYGVANHPVALLGGRGEPAFAALERQRGVALGDVADVAGRDELDGGVWLMLARQTQRTQRDSKLLRPASHRS